MALFLIAGLTLLPNFGERGETTSTLWCVTCGYAGTVDFLLNIVLFGPLGASLAALGWSRRRTFLAGFVVSLVIEVLQLTVIPGRYGSSGDLLANSIGALLGHFLLTQWHVVVRPSRNQARGLCIASLVLWLVVMTGTGWLLQPVFPDGIWFGQWKRQIGTFDQYTGDVTDARLGARHLPDNMLMDSGTRKEELWGHPLSIEAWGTTGTPTAAVAPIVSIYSGNQQRVILIGQEGTDFVFTAYSRADQFRLRPPVLHIVDALALPPDRPLHTGGSFSAGVWQGFVEIDGHRVSHRMALSVIAGWSLFLPFDYSYGPEGPLLDAVWAGMLAGMLGYYLRRTGAPWSYGVAGGAVLAGILVGATAFYGMPAPLWPAWAGTLAGVAGGWWLRSPSGVAKPS